MRTLLLVLCVGCYSTEYVPLPVDELSSYGEVTLYGLPTQYTAEDMHAILSERIEELQALGEVRDEHLPCLFPVDIVVATSFEDMHNWCHVPAAPESYAGCMYPWVSEVHYEGTGGWLMVLRPDHAMYDEGLYWILRHELTHQVEYCVRGSSDPHHESHLYP